MVGERALLLCCPVCGEPLRPGAGKLSCAGSHSFDVARAGYVNLLPSRKKLAATVGDSREMLAARARFLGAGYYEPLAAAVEDVARDAIDGWTGTERAVAEVGSGTGYYIGRLRERIGAPNLSYFGFDISKEAVKLSARADPEVTYALADVKRQIPLVDGSALVLLDVFAPRDAAEFRRVLDPDGVLIVALPAPEHMKELVDRFGLLKVPEDKARDVEKELGDELVLSARVPLSYELHLPADMALDLMAMGPSARHVDLERIRSELSDEVTVTASFTVLLFRPR